MFIRLRNFEGEFSNNRGYKNENFGGIIGMRKSINNQFDFTSTPITEVRFDLFNRHEMNPILRSLQYLYSHPKKLKQILGLIQKDINSTNRKDIGAIGLDYWEILVLSAVRLGCDLDYDALSDLADNHKNLRTVMGLSSCSTKRFPRSTIHGNISSLSWETIHTISHLVVEEGHKLRPKAMRLLGALPSADRSRADKLLSQLTDYITMTDHIRDLADRRVLKQEVIDAADKIHSIFEPHTELINRGKKPYPIEFGRRVFVLEDRERFVVDAFVMERGQTDDKVVIPVVDNIKARFGDRIDSISFDKGFYSPENKVYLDKYIPHPCLPKKGNKKGEVEMTREFKRSRRLHPGVESAINALESGKGLDVCRDKGEAGFERYVALAELGRNLQRLGEILLEQDRKKQKKKSPG